MTASAEAAPPRARVEVQGHRGARAARPENTLPAFEHALTAGADVLELDLGVTKDDRLVVIHDQVVSAAICLGPNGEPITSEPEVRSLTFEQLQRYDCGSKKHPRFPKQQPVPKARVPALDEVFDLVKASKIPAASKVRFNIELKSVPALPQRSPPPERFAELVVKAIRRAGLLDRCNVQSFDHRTLVASKKLEPKLPIAALISDTFPDHVALAKNLGAEIVSPDKEWITKEAVAALHAAGVRVIPWTANDPEDWRALVEMSVDGIITDDPEALIRWLSGSAR